MSSVGMGSLKPPAVQIHEIGDVPFAAFVKLFGTKEETLDRTSERIAKQLHFRLPDDFTPSALRNARYAASSRASSVSLFTSGGWRLAWK